MDRMGHKYLPSTWKFVAMAFARWENFLSHFSGPKLVKIRIVAFLKPIAFSLIKRMNLKMSANLKKLSYNFLTQLWKDMKVSSLLRLLEARQPSMISRSGERALRTTTTICAGCWIKLMTSISDPSLWTIWMRAASFLSLMNNIKGFHWKGSYRCEIKLSVDCLRYLSRFLLCTNGIKIKMPWFFPLISLKPSIIRDRSRIQSWRNKKANNVKLDMRSFGTPRIGLGRHSRRDTDKRIHVWCAKTGRWTLVVLWSWGWTELFLARRHWKTGGQILISSPVGLSCINYSHGM